MRIIAANQTNFEKNLDGSKTVSMTKGSGLNNHTVQNMFMPGIEINPADGEKLVITPIAGSSSYMVSIAGVNENIAPDCDKGERKIYSVTPDGQTIKAFARFKNNGVIELNGNDNFAVLFNELKIEFNELKGKYNSLVSLYNSHVHITTATVGASAVPGVLSPTVSAGTTSAANIDLAKSQNVLLKSN